MFYYIYTHLSDVMAGYTPSLQDNLGFHNTMQTLKPHDLEGTVQLGLQIISEWFRGNEGFRWTFKRPALDNNHTPDATFIQVKEVARNPQDPHDWVERQILLVECNRRSSDTANAWTDSLHAQMHDDLARNTHCSHSMFGAVIMGKKVRFYRFDGAQPLHQQLMSLHPHIFDMENANDVTKVENMMNYIKANLGSGQLPSGAKDGSSG